MKNKGFVAIDFEHLYPSHETACEVGAVRVVNGFVTGRFHSTILPPEEYCTGRSNSDILGYERDMLLSSPTFPEVFAQLRAFCGDLPLVAHHSATELAVLNKCCALYDITDLLGNGDLYDTFDHTKRSLIVSCQERDLPLLDHHNPLADAEMTAMLFLSIVGQEYKKVVRSERKSFAIPKDTNRDRVSSSEGLNKPRPSSEVKRTDTPFYGGTKVVVTGTFENFPHRADLERTLWQLGATVNSNVSSRTQFLVAGSGPGWGKIEKAHDFGIPILNEDELMNILNQ